MFSRKFQGDELMMIVRAARCRQLMVPDRVIATIAGNIVALHSTRRTNRAVALQVQTEFQAARMKTATPIEQARGAKVMPFHCDTELIDIAVERPPTFFHFTPGLYLG